MIDEILLPITHTKGDDTALAAAISLATHYGAHLTVIEPVSLPTPFPEEWWAAPNMQIAQIHADLREAGSKHASQLKERIAKEGISFEVRIVESFLTEPPRLAALHARYSDLCMVPMPESAADGSVAREFFDSLLFESGRPVLLVPQGRALELPFRRAVVAWQPTREATRALHDAIPLMRGVGSIDVVVVDPVVGETRHGQDPGTDIAAHLARHDLAVNVVSLPSRGDAVATALLRHATEAGADLIVAGGFGHSRMREWVLGGTTRELLQDARIPVLFSH